MFTGDPTISHSCSDKLARWACLGVQGALLSSLLAQPLYIAGVVIGLPPASRLVDDSDHPRPDTTDPCFAAQNSNGPSIISLEAAMHQAIAGIHVQLMGSDLGTANLIVDSERRSSVLVDTTA